MNKSDKQINGVLIIMIIAVGVMIIVKVVEIISKIRG